MYNKKSCLMIYFILLKFQYQWITDMAKGCGGMTFTGIY